MKLTSTTQRPRLATGKKPAPGAPGTRAQETPDVFSPSQDVRTSSSLRRVKNFAAQVATALVMGCVGVALVGCGVSGDAQHLPQTTAALAHKGSFSHQDCKRGWGQAGPDFLPLPGFVTRCETKSVGPAEAAELLRGGQEVTFIRALPGSQTTSVGLNGTRIEGSAIAYHSLKSANDALLLQQRLQNDGL